MKKYTFQLAVVLLIVSFCFTSCKKPADPSPSLKVTVVDNSDYSIKLANALVQLYKDAIQLKTLKTDIYGECLFADLAAGEYVVKTSLPGYQDSEQTITVQQDNTPCSVPLSKLNPTITIVSPTSSSQWSMGAAQSISWTSTDLTGKVKIELIKGTAVIRTLDTETANDGEYLWNIPTNLEAGSDVKIAISSIDFTNVTAKSDYFTILAVQAPLATTLVASSIATTTVTLNGSVNANGLPTSITFLYGTDNNSFKRIKPKGYLVIIRRFGSTGRFER